MDKTVNVSRPRGTTFMAMRGQEQGTRTMNEQVCRGSILKSESIDFLFPTYYWERLRFSFMRPMRTWTFFLFYLPLLLLFPFHFSLLPFEHDSNVCLQNAPIEPIREWAFLSFPLVVQVYQFNHSIKTAMYEWVIGEESWAGNRNPNQSKTKQTFHHVKRMMKFHGKTSSALCQESRRLSRVDTAAMTDWSGYMLSGIWIYIWRGTFRNQGILSFSVYLHLPSISIHSPFLKYLRSWSGPSHS